MSTTPTTSYEPYEWTDTEETPIFAEDLNHMEEGIGDAHDLINSLENEMGDAHNLIQLLMEQRSHIGMIVQSTTLDTEEKVVNLYGGTSWELIRGRFLLGESDEYPIGSTGGKTVYKLTAAIGACNGDSTSIGYVAADHSAYQAGVVANYVLRGTPVSYGSWNHGTPVTDASSSNRDTTVIPPYKTVYIWERTE